MGKTSKVRMVFTTCGSMDEAQKIAEELISSKLAACCNIIDKITSVYEWQGKIEKDIEILMIIKTFEDKLDLIESKISELHSYDVPEIISISADKVEKKYLQWMKGLLD